MFRLSFGTVSPAPGPQPTFEAQPCVELAPTMPSATEEAKMSLEAYLKQHKIQGAVNELVNSLLESKPADPFLYMVRRRTSTLSLPQRELSSHAPLARLRPTS